MRDVIFLQPKKLFAYVFNCFFQLEMRLALKLLAIIGIWIVAWTPAGEKFYKQPSKEKFTK